jgi:hypothetical protein
MASNQIQIKRTSVPGRVPTTTNLSTGELALNMADGILYSSNGSFVFELGANNTNVNVSANLSVKSIVANGSIGSVGQMLLSNGSVDYWHSFFTPGNFPPPSPVYGDIWYSTTFSKPYMWVYDGASSYWYDFLPY